MNEDTENAPSQYDWDLMNQMGMLIEVLKTLNDRISFLEEMLLNDG